MPKYSRDLLNPTPEDIERTEASGAVSRTSWQRAHILDARLQVRAAELHLQRALKLTGNASTVTR